SLAPIGPRLGTGRPQYSQSRNRLTLLRATTSRYSTSRWQRRQSMISSWANNLAILHNHGSATRKVQRFTGTRDNRHRRRSKLTDHIGSGGAHGRKASTHKRRERRGWLNGIRRKENIGRRTHRLWGQERLSRKQHGIRHDHGRKIRYKRYE